MAAIIFAWFTLAAWIVGMSKCYAHYCYFCGTVMNARTRMNLINQRVFTYPVDAMQMHCHLPHLLESGSAQLCDKPLCATLTPSSMEPGYTYPGNFTILGCAELILRPSMVRRIPLEAYTSDGRTICIEIENFSSGKKLKFSVCFCNTNWCNTGDVSVWTKSASSSTRITVSPRYTGIVKGFVSSEEGSGDSALDDDKVTSGHALSSEEFRAMVATKTPPAAEPPAATGQPIENIGHKTTDSNENIRWPFSTKSTTLTSVRNLHQYWNDESKPVTRAYFDESPRIVGEIRKQPQTRDVVSGTGRFTCFAWRLTVLTAVVALA